MQCTLEGTGDDLCCTRSLDDLLRRYEHYVPLWKAGSPHTVQGVRAQFSPHGWRVMLGGGVDNVFGKDTWDFDSHFLLDGCVHGFKLVDPGADIGAYESANYSSATVDARSEIESILRDELSSGKLTLTDSKPTCIHALGAVPKGTGGFRPITDASKPDGLSINSYMKETFQSFQFKSLDSVAEHLTENCYVGVSDISSAYRAVLIRPGDRQKQGLQWNLDGKEVYINDNFLSFGTRMAPFVFNRISDAVSRFVNASGYYCANYLDDFLVLGKTFQECQQAQLLLHKTLRSLGFYIAYKKVRSPARVQVYLGVEIDTVNMELRLPQEKLDKLYVELDFFKDRTRASKKQLQRLCGVLSHCATLVKGGRTFSHRVIGMLKRFAGKTRYVSLSKSFHADLEWWVKFSKWFNGSAKIIRDNQQVSVVYSDASGSGFGAFCDTDWLCGTWNQDIVVTGDRHGHGRPKPVVAVPDNINVRELYPILESARRWGKRWRDCKVKCITDNTQVVAAINKGRSVNEASMDILRLIFWESVVNNFHLIAQHVAGVDNVLADALSRLSDGSSIPYSICCRHRQGDTGARFAGGGATSQCMGPEYVEDQGESVAPLHQVLHVDTLLANPLHTEAAL